ncbi:MAG TPA: hypothetical protein VMF13_07150, partial [Luteitalea sp.]|nr:hypothetical protein [Luteitalea sp.]
GLHDAWEVAFGLNPSDATDASLDPDNDGRTNAQEYADGTHPNGVPVRYFAEGADGGFFSTSLALFNPAQIPAAVNVRFLGPNGATASRPVTLAAQSPAYLDVRTLGLPFNEFSIVVEGGAQIVAERRMTWGALPSVSTHTGTGVAAPSSTWHFAEGATVAGMQTFFLLQNPGSLPALATMQYLLADGTVQQRTHTVPAQSRLTVWANQEGAPLHAAEFATTISADQPLVAERAMIATQRGAPLLQARSSPVWLHQPRHGSWRKEPRVTSSTPISCSPIRQTPPRRSTSSSSARTTPTTSTPRFPSCADTSWRLTRAGRSG